MSESTSPVLDLSAVLEVSPPSDPTRRIYTNRTLDMAEIQAIGFDMDYTLVQYHQHALDQLAVAKTIDKLIENHGYSEEIRKAKIDYDFIIRGLVVDKRNGYICKLDQDRVVTRCYYGYQKVSLDEQQRVYGTKPITLLADDFIRVDTLFSLPESTLMAGIIEHYKELNQPLPKEPGELCVDIRQSIDEAHCDNTLKAEIIADLPRYVIQDPDLGPTLHKLKSAGKILFLLTNSEAYYTDAVMKFILDGVLPFFESWRDYFEVILVDGRKPSFFNATPPIYRLDEQYHRLDEDVQTFHQRVIYSGGHIQILEQILNLTGDSILYVGDHIYSDIVKSKRNAWWRTALIVQEMKADIQRTLEHTQQLKRVHDLDHASRRLDDMINYQKTLTLSLQRVQKLIVALTSPETHVIDSTRERALKDIDKKQALLDQTLREIDELETQIESTYNRYWGQTYRARQELSLIGHQVQNYADIYTSQVSNFLFYSPNQHFRAARNFLPHEHEHLSLTDT
jgi:HAD superfamily 5'-nucleotidase-like hydrolase